MKYFSVLAASLLRRTGMPVAVMVLISARELLRRTGMSGAVMVRINTREYDRRVSRNVKSNRRSTRSIPHITKYWARAARRACSRLDYILHSPWRSLRSPSDRSHRITSITKWSEWSVSGLLRSPRSLPPWYHPTMWSCGVHNRSMIIRYYKTSIVTEGVLN